MADPKLAIDFLYSLGGAGGSLEGITNASAVDPLKLSGPVPERLEKTVATTIEKIGNRAPLERAEQFALEAIIIPDKRPAIDVLENGGFTIEHTLWQHLAKGAAAANIRQAITAVGRIELPGHPSIPYGGTGFVVGKDLLMTNRHVAELFANGLGQRGLGFRSGQTSGIDFEQRVDGGSHFLDVSEVVLIHPYWDMALLRVRDLPDSIEPLKLASSDESMTPRDIVVIGYPAFDKRNNPGVQQQVFGGIYNVKRLMPGRLNGIGQAEDNWGKTVETGLHDSSTLGGASGSAVLDPHSGAVVALHWGGLYLKTNFGVPVFELARDRRLAEAGLAFDGDLAPADGPWDAYWHRTESGGKENPPRPAPTPAPAAVNPRKQQATFTLPLMLTVSFGEPTLQAAAAVGPAMNWGPNPGADDIVAEVEGVVEDYADRRGYDPEFIGRPVPLPVLTRNAEDILDFAGNGWGVREKVLRYEHFSVQMSRSRRMCLWSAVNIDGGQSRKAKRVGWRRDPRIPTDAQILNECYGNPPKFSRGHMTRREDPVWGDVATAERGNADSMCVTNTTPQMQAFNSPIWLALEDYALEHARSDAMRISVFTGPYFSAEDKPRHGVLIPRAFWKVIAFIHDETGELCATGYEMSQEKSLPPPDTEFVFGGFQSPQLAIATQVPIRAIEARAGLSFGPLADRDPKAGGTEGIAEDAPLLAMEQIEFD